MKYLSFLFVALFLLQLTTFAQTKWFKYAGNPVLDVGSLSEWDSWRVNHHDVYFDGTTYKMWYTGETPPPQRHGLIGLATSTDGITWTKDTLHNPVLPLGPPGSWDSQTVSSSVVIFDDNIYKMWYGGLFGNAFRIGYATSPDGISWTKDSLHNPVINTGSTGSWEGLQVSPNSVIFDGAIYKMWYAGFDGISFRIGYATSSNGINWDKETSNPVLDIGEPGEWDDVAVFSADVLFDGTLYHMWYNGYDGITFRIGYATSSNGLSWEKHPDNPILDLGESGDWDDSEVGHPRVIFDGTAYQMWFQGDDGSNSRIGYAEDFSNLAHADSVIIEESYVIPNTDPLNILGRVISPEGHAVTAKAMILSDDGSIQDSVEIIDDGLHGDGTAGDGIYGGYLPVTNTNEINYSAGIKTVDLVTGFTRNGLYWNIIDRFTTKGPIKFENLEITSTDTIANSGDRIKFKLTLKNYGSTDTVYNVDVKIILFDYSIENTTFGSPTYGDIAPGESLTNSSSDFALTFSDSVNPGSYAIGLEISSNDETFWYDTFTFDVVTSVEEELSILPKKYALRQNYPNPFNPATIIKYQIPELSFVTIKVYDVLGKEITTLVNEEKPAGAYSLEFDAANFPSGIYFYQLRTSSFVQTKKMLLLK